jgi:1-acyl-sn-glycerol-3-phosphate acyltransferase
MPPHHVARLRLLALWLAVSLQAGVLAAVATVTLTTLQSGKYYEFRPPAIAGTLVLACFPALLVTPILAALAGSGRAWHTLVGSGAVSASIVGWAAFNSDNPWLSELAVAALASAFFAAAGLRLLYDALPDAGTRSSTGSVVLALAVFAMVSIGFEVGLGVREEGEHGQHYRYAVVAGAVFALVASIAGRIQPIVSFQPNRGIVSTFVAGVGEGLRFRYAIAALLGLGIWAFVTGAIVVGVIRLVIAPDDPQPGASVENFTTRLVAAGLWGVVLSALNRNSFRFGWLLVFCAIAILACLIWLRAGGSVDGPLIGIGLALGASFPALVHYIFTWSATRHPGIVPAMIVATGCAAGLAVGLAAAAVGEEQAVARASLLNTLLVVAGVATVGAGVVFYRPAVEGAAEFVLWPFYRVKAVGPGTNHFPSRGPCLVIANHAAWFDPLFLAKVLPIPVTPMMTSKFYDLPVLSLLMRHVIGTIRVPEVPYRHEAPELKEAVAALDRGECVVLFPEGYLRRREDQPLRRFGRGIWKILSDRPGTPVFAGWIEGNWGSFFSYRNGPPTKGKRIDFWQPINIGLLGPLTIDPMMLADHMATRIYLMQQVAAARGLLGLPPIEVPVAAAEGEKE